MTLFGWDASHFDGPLSLGMLQRARAEGITFFTHKLAEGLQDTEGSLDDTALSAARAAGIPFIGGYLIPRSNATPAAQVAYWLQIAAAGEAWWKSHPGWFWQIDLELWGYDNVEAAVGIACAQLLRAATGRAVVLYASRGQYGNILTAWDGPLWNADYRGGPGYPGDGWTVADKGAIAGWAPYSGKSPAILQYTSSATIAGLTTCDANAYRGTVADFAAMIGGKTVALLDKPQSDWLEYSSWGDDAMRYGSDVMRGGPEIHQPHQAMVAIHDIQAKLAALSIPTPAPVDPAALSAALLDPAFLAALAKAVNDDAAARMGS